MRNILTLLIVLLSFSTSVFADNSNTAAAPKADSHKLLFTVETDPASSADSLNRVSGDYDRGYSSTSQSFKSDDHYAPGPFGRQNETAKQKSTG